MVDQTIHFGRKILFYCSWWGQFRKGCFESYSYSTYLNWSDELNTIHFYDIWRFIEVKISPQNKQYYEHPTMTLITVVFYSLMAGKVLFDAAGVAFLGLIFVSKLTSVIAWRNRYSRILHCGKYNVHIHRNTHVSTHSSNRYKYIQPPRRVDGHHIIQLIISYVLHTYHWYKDFLSCNSWYTHNHKQSQAGLMVTPP